MQQLRPHQQKALTQLKDGYILWGKVGTGKSRVAVAYYEAEHRHKNVYVITTAKKRDSNDWGTEFAGIVVGKERDATVHGVLTVDSWNNIGKYVDVKDAFFIFDEQRLIGRGSWVKSFLKIAKKNKWILLTATPGDTWLDYIPVFVANGFFKNRTQFHVEHVVYAPFSKFPKVIRYLNEGKLKKYRNQILVHMPYETEIIRKIKTVNVSHNEALVQSVIKNRWHIFKNKPIRDITELFYVLRQVINSDPSRLRAIEEILEDHPKLIIFYNFNYELDILRRLGEKIEIAEWNGWKHEELPTSEKWAYLVQYVAGSEGWNCVETNSTVFYSLTYSYKMWAQAFGRIDRMNTPFNELHYFILRSKSVMDKAIWRSLIAKRNFQPSKFPILSMAKSTQELLPNAQQPNN